MALINKPTLIRLRGKERPLGKIWTGSEWIEDETEPKRESVYTETELMDEYRKGVESIG